MSPKRSPNMSIKRSPTMSAKLTHRGVFTTLVNTWALAAHMIVMVFTTLVNTWVNV